MKELESTDNTIFTNVPCSIWNEDTMVSSFGMIRYTYQSNSKLYFAISDSSGEHEYQISLVSTDTTALATVIIE